MKVINKQILKLCPNFSPLENWGDLSKINPALIVLLQTLRTGLGKSIYINNAFETGGHSDKSQHYIGNAADFTVDRGRNFVSIYQNIMLILESVEMDHQVGFGAYPYWKTSGFHIDVRSERARWAMDKQGDYVGIDIAMHDFKYA